MQHFSDKFGKLAEAMAKVQAGMKPALPNRDNPHFKSKYADLESVMTAVRPLLGEHGLFLTQPYHEEGGVIMLTTRLIHAESEQWVDSSHPIPKSANLQQFGSALSYARRYMVVSMLGIVTSGEDDDGMSASMDRPGKRVPARLQGRGSQYRRQPQASDIFDPAPTLADELVDDIRKANSTAELQSLAKKIAFIKHRDPKAITPEENEMIGSKYTARRTFLANRDKAEAQRAKAQGVTVTEQKDVTVEESSIGGDEMGYEKMSQEIQGDAA